jgi:restriction endonuclease S subunit
MSLHLNELIFGAAYNALTIVKLKNVKIPLPPIETQKEIVARIEEEQQLVATNKSKSRFTKVNLEGIGGQT